MAEDITVLAGNGKSGRRIAAALRVAGHHVRVAGRRGPVRFDWHEPATWPGVVDGADALYLVAPDGAPDPIGPFVDAALAAGVQRIAMISGRGLEHFDGRFGGAMVVGEQAVAATGRGTILRASNFAQGFTEDAFAPGVTAGRLALPAEHVGDAFVDLGDVAAVAARVLTEGGHEGRTYELTGPAVLTFEQAVDVLAAATGRDIRYEALTPDAYAAELRAAGVGEFGVGELGGLFAIMGEGHLASTSDDVPRLLGRPARSFTDWALEQAALGAWTRP
ncbi:SDR family NAD(P)-dependent oxidoreductase [Actinomycetospora flava]|uniref:SDR family NAD(P)-dependent oxidoreductase n=1 Tax=Actinomycetospora flava TaxID=3129232 RepID=A0ABU8MCM3_9PSEU